MRAAPAPAGLPEADDLLHVQLLRFVREHGLNPGEVFDGGFTKNMT